jgi:hypothetical protein
MKIRFSRHARRQMKWRKIAEKEVKEAINNPEKLEDTIKGRKNAYKTTKGRLLKITYRPENNEIVVITTIVKGE